MDAHFVLHLIRHAPTAGNQEKRYIGWTDEPVLPFDAPADEAMREVWGSDLLRCRQTAEVLFPRSVYHANPDWRECNFGAWEQQTYQQLQHDPRYRSWIDDPANIAPPDGESLVELSKRIGRAVRALPEGHEFTIITHGGPIRWLAVQATGGMFHQQTALHGHIHRMVWQNRKAYEEGQRCISFSVAPLMANASM